jgi:hypothetical protein
VTHPFHPLRGQELLVLRRGVGRHREVLVVQQEDGREKQMPAAWTDLREPDEYVELTAGQARLRLPDLLQLTALVSELMRNKTEKGPGGCQGNSADVSSK